MPHKYAPLEHHDYEVLDKECSCDICCEWREKRRTMVEMNRNRSILHAHNCNCSKCTAIMSHRTAYLAALNRRDLYCEASWHARNLTRTNNMFDVTVTEPMSGFALQFMEWLRGELYAKSDSWWEARGVHLPMEYWFDSFSEAVAASGSILGLAPQRRTALQAS